MKNDMILAFKKTLSQIDDYNKIMIKYSKNTYFGGYSNYIFDDFDLSQLMSMKDLKYKSLSIILTHDEWLELRNLVEDRKTKLQTMESNKDYVDLINILKS
jgi:hypothetical protein